MTDTTQSTAKLAVELWKLLGVFERAVVELPVSRQARVAAQVRFSRSRLDALTDEAGLKLVTFEGAMFSANLPASPVNAEDISTPERAHVVATVEPAVVTDGNVILMGKVFLGE